MSEKNIALQIIGCTSWNFKLGAIILYCGDTKSNDTMSEWEICDPLGQDVKLMWSVLPQCFRWTLQVKSISATLHPLWQEKKRGKHKIVRTVLIGGVLCSSTCSGERERKCMDMYICLCSCRGSFKRLSKADIPGHFMLFLMGQGRWRCSM